MRLFREGYFCQGIALKSLTYVIGSYRIDFFSLDHTSRAMQASRHQDHSNWLAQRDAIRRYECMRGRFVRFLALTLAIFQSGSAELDAKSTWLKVSTDEVTVISDAPRKVAVDYCVQYSAFRQSFIALFAPAGRRPPPTVLLLFATRGELKEHLESSKENVINFSTGIDEVALTALAHSGAIADDLNLAIEFDTIWSLRRAGYALPLWMAQGTGEVMATIRVKPRECVIDANRSWSDLIWSNQRLSPWPRFFESYQAAAEYRGPDADGVYQAQAWALMTAILFKEKTPRAQFLRLAGMFPSTPGMSAVSEMLEVPEDQLTQAIQRRLKQQTMYTLPISGEAILAQVKVAPADEAEVKVYRAEVMIASRRVAEGNQLLNEAVALAPNSPFTNEALARRALREGDRQTAVRHFRVAITAGSTNPTAWLTSAADYLEPSAPVSYAGVREKKDPAAALDQIHRAMELSPAEPRARLMLGRAYVAFDKPNEAGVAELTAAITDDEVGLQIRYYRGLLYSYLGRDAEALADFDVVVQHPLSSGSLRGEAKNARMPLLFEADQKVFNQLLSGQQFDAARALADRRLTESAGTPVAKEYAKMREWVDETQTLMAAVRLYQAKNYSEAREVARRFIQERPQSSRVRDAERVIAKVDAALSAPP